MSTVGIKARAPAGHLSAADVAKFTSFVALAAIFFDAALGHGVAWENDPYWTYWITKTFLIATVFGLGTAWFGIGEGRGALITAVHTLILTIYYWTLSPIGLPSAPTWLDLEHTWITGVPIHFGVIYAGYLLALWGWRHRRAQKAVLEVDTKAVALRALLVAIGIVIVAGGLGSMAIGEFPGFTWFLVRLLITIPFLLAWWGLFGTDLLSSVIGGFVLAFMWATYSQFLGPIGLPDSPLRVLNPAPPPAIVRWLDYRELWLISLPIYVVVMTISMAIISKSQFRTVRRAISAAALIPIVLLTTGLTVPSTERGVTATFRTSGRVGIEDVGSGTGSVRIVATDMGNRVSPLPPNDRLSIDAVVTVGGHTYEVIVRRPMVEDPTGRETTWWGVGLGVDYGEETGNNLRTDLIAFGMGELRIDGTIVGRGLPIKVIASEEHGYGMNLEVGSDVTPIPGRSPSELYATWRTYVGEPPEGSSTGAHYIGGGIVLSVLLALGLLLNRREVNS